MTSPPTTEQVTKALDGVQDPEIRRPITELGMVKDVQADGGIVRVDVYLTVAGCPMKDRLTTDVKAAVAEVPGVDAVSVVLVDCTSVAAVASSSTTTPGFRIAIGVAGGRLVDTATVTEFRAVPPGPSQVSV